jgi:3-oxoacyl-ACP reductase-like protein
MGIFAKIKNAIFGHKAAAPAPAAVPTPSQAPAAPTPQAHAPATPAPAAPQQTVDVEAVLEDLGSHNSQHLNWRTSIVDLMKLVGMESSLTERKELAKELGYTGALDGSAAMNIWLHKRVLQELAHNGGKVPVALLD